MFKREIIQIHSKRNDCEFCIFSAHENSAKLLVQSYIFGQFIEMKRVCRSFDCRSFDFRSFDFRSFDCRTFDCRPFMLDKASLDQWHPI